MLIHLNKECTLTYTRNKKGDLDQIHKSHQYISMSWEPFLIIGCQFKNSLSIEIDLLSNNLYNRRDIECILKDLFLKHNIQKYISTNQEKLQIIGNSDLNTLYKKLILLLCNLYNHRYIECILKDLQQKHSGQSYTRMSLVMHRLKTHQNLSILNTEMSQLLYNLYNRRDNLYKLTGLFQIHKILSYKYRNQEKLLPEKNWTRYNFNSQNLSLPCKQYNRHDIESTLKDLWNLRTIHRYTHKSQEKLQLIGSQKQHNRYTMLTQLLYNLYNHHDTGYILMGLYLKQYNQSHTHTSQEKLQLTKSSKQHNQYTKKTLLLYNLYNHHDTEYILMGLYLKHSNYSYTHKSQEKFQLIGSSKQHNQYTKKTLLLYNLHNRRHIEYILKDQQQKHSNYSYTHTSQEKLQLIESSKQHNQYTKKTLLLYNLHNRHHIEYILKDQQQKHSSYSHIHTSQEKLQLIGSLKQHIQYTKKTLLLYNPYNRRHIEYILKDQQQKHSSY